MQHRVDEIVEGLSQELRELTLAIHCHPELGLEEYEACALQVEILKNMGLLSKRNTVAWTPPTRHLI